MDHRSSGVHYVCRVIFFHDPINAINAGGCLIVFSGVILYKVSLIFGNNTEAYSPIDQQNDNESNNNINDPGPVGQSNDKITRPRIERTPSTGSGNRGQPKDDSSPEETDEFIEEGLQDKMLKLKL